jgi:hypothetical protein
MEGLFLVVFGEERWNNCSEVLRGCIVILVIGGEVGDVLDLVGCEYFCYLLVIWYIVFYLFVLVDILFISCKE